MVCVQYVVCKVLWCIHGMCVVSCDRMVCRYAYVCVYCVSMYLCGVCVRERERERERERICSVCFGVYVCGTLYMWYVWCVVCMVCVYMWCVLCVVCMVCGM